MSTRTLLLLSFLLLTPGVAQEREPAGPIGVVLERNPSEPFAVTRVVAGTPAAEMGVQVGDILVKLNEDKVDNIAQVREVLGRKPLYAGDKITLSVRRGAEELELRGTMQGQPTVVGQPAPAWEIARWGQLPEGAEGPTLESLRGKTVVVFCFQSWCPGCHSRGFPLHKKMEERYAENDGVVFLYVQTIFEGFERNSFEAGLKDLEKYGVTGSYGFDAADPELKKPSSIMAGYKTRGTPWSIVIDKEGVVRYSAFTPGEDGELSGAIDAALE